MSSTGLTCHRHKGAVAESDGIPMGDAATGRAAKLSSQALLRAELQYWIDNPKHAVTGLPIHLVSIAVVRARLALL